MFLRILLVALMLGISACGSAATTIATLSPPYPGEVIVAKDQASLFLLQTSTDAVQELVIASGQLFTVPNPSRVEVIKAVPGDSVVPAAPQIRILEGPHKGVEGWVPSEWVQ